MKPVEVLFVAKRGTLEHPKTKRLARALNVPGWAALGLLEAFWQWVSRYTPDGLLTDEDFLDCVDTIRFEGRLQDVLHSCGLLDETESGWYVHDWHDHADDTTKKGLEKAGKAFANGSRVRRTPQSEPNSQKTEPARESVANDSRLTREQYATAKPSLALTKPINPPTPRTWEVVWHEVSAEAEGKGFDKKVLGTWFKYKSQRKSKPYTPIGTSQWCAQWFALGPGKLEEAITFSIAQNYEGITVPRGSPQSHAQEPPQNGRRPLPKASEVAEVR